MSRAARYLIAAGKAAVIIGFLVPIAAMVYETIQVHIAEAAWNRECAQANARFERQMRELQEWSKRNAGLVHAIKESKP